MEPLEWFQGTKAEENVKKEVIGQFQKLQRH